MIKTYPTKNSVNQEKSERPINRALYAFFLGGFLAIAAAIGRTGWRPWNLFEPNDPDGAMQALRATILRAHENAYMIPRGAAGEGFLIHWSAPFDSIAAALSWILESLGMRGGPDTMGLALGIIVLFSTMVYAGSVAVLGLSFARKVRGAWILAGAAAGVMALADGYAMRAQPGTGDHHMTIMALAMAGFAIGFSSKDSMRQIAGGVLMGFSIWFGVEALPFVFGFVGVIGAKRAFDDRNGLGLTPLAAGICSAIALGFVIEILLGALGPNMLGAHDVDRISLAQLIPAVFLFAIALAEAVRPAFNNKDTKTIQRLLGALVVVFGWAGISLFLYPEQIQGASAIMSDELVTLWWNNIGETGHVKSIEKAISYQGPAIFGVVALFIATLINAQKKQWENAVIYASIAGCFAIAVAFGLLSVRFTPWSAAAAPIGAMAILGSLPLMRPVRAINIIILIGAVPIAVSIATDQKRKSIEIDNASAAISEEGAANRVYTENPENPEKTTHEPDASKQPSWFPMSRLDDPDHYCTPRAIADAIKELGWIKVYVDQSHAAGVMLHNKDVKPTGGSFQRNLKDIRRMMNAAFEYDANAPEAYNMFKTLDLDGAVVCSRKQMGNKKAVYFAERLHAGNPPSWLEPIPITAKFEKIGILAWKYNKNPEE